MPHARINQPGSTLGSGGLAAAYLAALILLAGSPDLFAQDIPRGNVEILEEPTRLSIDPSLVADLPDPTDEPLSFRENEERWEILDSAILPAGCCGSSTTGAGVPGSNAAKGPAAPGSSAAQIGQSSTLFPIDDCGCGKNRCIPGQDPCYACHFENKGFFGRFACNLYGAICCPDECYEPRWIPQANSAFFMDSARPQSHQRYRWDAVYNYRRPDRAEYFWARDDGSGLGPQPVPPLQGEIAVGYNEISMSTEAAGGNFSMTVDTPYRETEPFTTPGHSGFADITIGTKSLLFDCEFLQLAFMMKTFVPAGSASKGLGTGHVSLEPSILATLKFDDKTYLQAQLANWFPIAGDPQYAGGVLHSHLSLNRVVYYINPAVPIIVNLESSSFHFQNGAYTDPVRGTRSATGQAAVYLGPGIRTVICDVIDFGVGSQFALNKDHMYETIVRSEFRWRF